MLNIRMISLKLDDIRFFRKLRISHEDFSGDINSKIETIFNEIF